MALSPPDFAVSVQPVAPSVQHMLPHDMPIPVGNKTYYVNVNRPCMHIMTQFLEGFSTCGDAFKENPQDQHKDEEKMAAIAENDSPFMRAYKRTTKAKKSFFLEKNGLKYPLQGLGKMLALPNFIYDMNCIGKSGATSAIPMLTAIIICLCSIMPLIIVSARGNFGPKHDG